MERAKKSAAVKPAKAKPAVVVAADTALQRRLVLIALFIVSGVGLIFEITLTRLFSLFFEYHFTFLAVSLAVLGLSLGAASAHYLKATRLHSMRTLTSVLIALSVALSLASMFIAWFPPVDTIFPRALVALVPFFFVGLFDALAFENFTAYSGALYAADLIGAALGVVAVIGLLYLWSAFSMTLFLAALVGLIAVVFVLHGEGRSRKMLVAAGSLILGVALLGANLASGAVDFNPFILTGVTRDKTMVYILQDKTQLGKIIYTAYSPFARVDVVQTGDHRSSYIFADGGAGAYMLPYDGNPASLTSLSGTIEYLPFTSGNTAKTLVIGAGGGKDILMALNAKAQAITAVEVNPAVIAATRHFADYNGNVLDLPQVNMIEGDARSFVERTSDQYDLIYMNLVYTQSVEPASQALVESYIFTTEAFKTYLQRLNTGGRLTIVAHNGIEGSRAMLTALQAFQELGIGPAQALDHLWLWKASSADETTATTVLVVGKDALPTQTIQALNNAAQTQGMTPLFAPGTYETLFAPLRTSNDLNHYIDADASYNLAPTSDDQPYFFNTDFGLPPAIKSALVLAGLLALALLGLGLVIERPTEMVDNRRWRITLGYAVLIGLGFMLVEVPLIQRFQLLLGQPILSLAAVLATLLLAGGVGSLISQRWRTISLPTRVTIAGIWIAGVVVVYWFALPPLVSSLLGLSFAARLLAIIVLTAVLGVPMGIPFPSLLRLAGEDRQQVALLWAINGAFSVLGSTLATVISMLWGFKWALIVGAGAYLVLALIVWVWMRASTKVLAAAQ